jgi:phosphonate transport system ATP-binding protein
MIEQLYRNKADPAPQFEAVDAKLDAARPLC